MEQVAIITKLVEEMIAMNCGEREMAHFILNLDCAVRTLTHIKEDTPRQMARDLKWEAGRAEREAKEAKEKEEKRLIQERQEEYKKEAQRERRRELYQLKKAEKKARLEQPMCLAEFNMLLDEREKQIRKAEDKEEKRKRKVEDKWVRKGGEKPEWIGEGGVSQA
jgi:hypothetical protein